MRQPSRLPRPGRFRETLIIIGVAAAWSAGLVARASVPQTAAPPAAAKPVADLDDDALDRLGGTTTEHVCTECHPFDDIIVMRRTVKGWKDVMTTMTNKGAQATDDQFTLIRRYLTRFYGVVPVNSATADDLASVLGLSAKEAAAIVEYRTAHGRFADAAALAGVPGIDRHKIDEQLEAISFN